MAALKEAGYECVNQQAGIRGILADALNNEVALGLFLDEAHTIYNEKNNGTWDQLHALVSDRNSAVMLSGSDSRLSLFVKAIDTKRIQGLGHTPQSSLNQTKLQALHVHGLTSKLQYEMLIKNRPRLEKLLFPKVKHLDASKQAEIRDTFIRGWHIRCAGRLRGLGTMQPSSRSLENKEDVLGNIPEKNTVPMKILHLLCREQRRLPGPLDPFSMAALREHELLRVVRKSQPHCHSSLDDLVDESYLWRRTDGKYTFYSPHQFLVLAKIYPVLFISHCMKDCPVSAFVQLQKELVYSQFIFSEQAQSEAKMSQTSLRSWEDVWTEKNDFALVVLTPEYCKRVLAAEKKTDGTYLYGCAQEFYNIQHWVKRNPECQCFWTWHGKGSFTETVPEEILELLGKDVYIMPLHGVGVSEYIQGSLVDTLRPLDDDTVEPSESSKSWWKNLVKTFW